MRTAPRTLLVGTLALAALAAVFALSLGHWSSGDLHDHVDRFPAGSDAD